MMKVGAGDPDFSRDDSLLDIGKRYQLEGIIMERETGSEPATACLEGRNSTN